MCLLADKTWTWSRRRQHRGLFCNYSTGLIFPGVGFHWKSFSMVNGMRDYTSYSWDYISHTHVLKLFRKSTRRQYVPYYSLAAMLDSLGSCFQMKYHPLLFLLGHYNTTKAENLLHLLGIGNNLDLLLYSKFCCHHISSKI